jgi:ribosome-binding protein aMBF1 (putative translation factor)
VKFREHLNLELNDPEFKEAFEEEKYLLELSLRITEDREQQGLFQRQLADKSHVTQQ